MRQEMNGTMSLEEWKRWVMDYAYDNHGRYWTMDKTPLPLREQAVSELAAEGRLRQIGRQESYGLTEWERVGG